MAHQSAIKPSCNSPLKPVVLFVWTGEEARSGVPNRNTS